MKWISKVLNPKEFGILTLLIFLWVFLMATAGDSFLSNNNIENLLRRTALYGVLGIGVAFVIITSGIDLSIGSVVCLSACLLAVFLSVAYQPFDDVKVTAFDSNQVTVAGTHNFSEGDRLAFFQFGQGKLAKPLVAEVQSVDGATISFDKTPKPSDDWRLVKTYPIASFQEETKSTPASIEMTTGGEDLSVRDWVYFVHPKSGQKDKVVQAVDGNTIVIKQDLGSDFNNEWLAIPAKRKPRMSAVAAVSLVLLIGIGLGFLHGFLITKLELQPFVVTLCGLLFYRSFSRYLVADQSAGFGNEFDGLRSLATGKWHLFGADNFGIPYPLLIMIGIAIVAGIFLTRSVWGRYMAALGRNVEAARFSGINTDRVTIVAYVICTGLAAIGGMLFALDANSVAPSSFGNFFELYAIAAAVLGGCSLRGGEGGIIGVVIGTAVMQTLYNLIVLLKISDKLEFAIIGLVILVGVIADVIVKRIVAKRRAMLQAQKDAQAT